MLNQPKSFDDEITVLMDETRALYIVFLDFNKTLNTVSHNILIDKQTLTK